MSPGRRPVLRTVPIEWVPHPSPLAKGGGRTRWSSEKWDTVRDRNSGLFTYRGGVGGRGSCRARRLQSTLRTARREARPPEDPTETVTHPMGYRVRFVGTIRKPVAPFPTCSCHRRCEFVPHPCRVEQGWGINAFSPGGTPDCSPGRKSWEMVRNWIWSPEGAIESWN